jgi:streptogramin lyase
MQLLRLTVTFSLLAAALPAQAPPSVTLYSVLSSGFVADAVAAGPDGALWFTGVPTPLAWSGCSIGSITIAGNPRPPYPLSAPLCATVLTTGPDGAVWFAGVSGGSSSFVGSITTAGLIPAIYPLPQPKAKICLTHQAPCAKVLV